MLVASVLEKSLSTAAGSLAILRGISLEIKAGETLAIVGASGSGKSTLLGLLAGLDLPTAGSVLIDGVDITALDEEARATLRAQKIGFVFQNFQLLTGLTALENVMLPLELKHVRDAQSLAAQQLEKVGLGARLDHYPRQLSGGEQQRVAIARAFVAQPALLLADEPTGNLDTQTGRYIMDLLFDLNREAGTTLVLVTHDEALAARCSRRVYMQEGMLAESV